MSSTKTQETKLPQWQEDFIRQEILPRGIEIADTEYTPYEGEMIAGMTPLGEQALSGFGGLDTSGRAYSEAADVQRGLTGFSPQAMQSAQLSPTSTMDAAQMGGIERMRAAQLRPAQTMQGVGAVDAARAPGQIDVDTLAATDFGAYMSPYTQNVINRSLETLGGAQEQALNKLGAQATAARAFGGSRQGIAEAGTREAYGKQAADLVAGLQEKAFTQALGSGQFDIGNVQQARALQSGQQMTAETLGQQAREAGAARDQAARAGNMAAANQFSIQQAQFEQAAAAQNAQAANARAAQQAQLEQAARSGNMAALNQAASTQAGFDQAANAANYQGQFTGAGIQSAAANAMGSLAGQGLQSQLSGLGAQMSAGEQERALEQAQLQADYAMFQEQQAYPLSQLNAVMAAGSGIPAGLGTVSTRDPFGGLAAVGSVLGGIGGMGQGGFFQGGGFFPK